MTVQSIGWTFRNGAVGMRFRYCDWPCCLPNVLNTSLFPSPVRRISKLLLVPRSVTHFSCRRVWTGVLSYIFPCLYISKSIESSHKIRDAGTDNLSVCSNENLRSHIMTATHRFCVMGTLQSVVGTNITKLNEVYYITYCVSPLLLLTRWRII